MKHPFQVGGKYRNYDGEYEVLSIDGPTMRIRYSDGKETTATVETQRKALLLIASEEKENKKMASGKDSSTFAGFQEKDFQNGVKGTEWRKLLGRLLVAAMPDTERIKFKSFPVPREPRLHIARQDGYTRDNKEQKGKFVVELDPERGSYGFRIEKNSGPMSEAWDWFRFIAAVENDTALRDQVREAMGKYDLHWEVLVGEENPSVTTVRLSPDGLIWEQKGGKENEVIDWPSFVERLRALPENEWCNLFLLRSVEKEEAISMGYGIANRITDVFQSLLPLFLASTSR